MKIGRIARSCNHLWQHRGPESRSACNRLPAMHVSTPTPPRTNPEIDRTHEFFDALFPPPRDFRIRLWNGEEFGGEEDTRFTLVINSPAATRRIFGLPVEVAL